MNGGASLRGGCLCGAVRYRAGPALYAPTVCHCTSCRRASGAHGLPWFTVTRASLTFEGDAPAQYRSSPGVVRSHCARCGTPIGYEIARRPGEIDLTLGSLDDPSGFAPADHIWMQDALAWDHPADGLPQYPAARPE
jgi:hypothetical protein